MTLGFFLLRITKSNYKTLYNGHYYFTKELNTDDISEG